MDGPLIAAGVLALAAAATHGLGGEVWVVRKLEPDALPRSRFGGPRMTMAMIHVTWHLTTVAFASVGCALLASAALTDADTSRAVAVMAAAACTGFAAVILGMGIGTLTPRSLLRHPAPVVLTATAALAWWGAL